ncbi:MULTISPECIES: ABC transporter substrate-binding protein [Paenibacillus]|uniref:ABC transporter substrate-binding protein n=1 Tax=Paenibacillus vini TaxID=1476024 RepID=A0ABQ4M7C2_9BACL|nr:MULTISPECIES: ABC transporter substrate-binding protein [Paenibacillus]GIP51875.1 ABC transporter substrate-binding protein [Paenibacillus vini]
MKKKVSTMLALLMAVVFVLSACGSKTNNDSKNATGENTPATTNEGEGTTNLKPYKLTLVYPGTAQKDLALVQEEMSKYLTEKINATIELKPIDWGSWTDKTNLMKISGESFDLMFTAGWFGYGLDVSKGQFIELNDLMEKYGKDIPTVLGEDFIKGSQINGKSYAVPTKKEFAQGFGFVLNKDLVDKYQFNTEGIKTLEEMEEMFKTIKENEPGIVPVVSNKFASTWSAANYDNSMISRDSKELKVIDTLEDPKFIDFLKRMRQWNLNGWFDKDVVTSDSSGQADNMLKSGKAFALAQSLKPGKDKEMSVTMGLPLVQVETAEPYTTTGEATGAMLAISRTSKDPERAMMFLNMLYTDAKLLNMLDWGIEGKHYVKVSDNMIDYPEGVTAETQGYPSPGGWMFGNQFISYLWANEDPDKWEQFEKFNASAERSIALGFAFDETPVKAELAAVGNVDKEFQMVLNAGAIDDVEGTIAKYKAKRDAAGFQKILEEKQRQLDEWAKTSK